MNTRGRSGRDDRTARVEETNFTNLKLAPIARAFAFTLAAGGMIGNAHAVQPFSPAWFANKSAIQNTVAATGMLPNGTPVSSLNPNSQVARAAAQTQKSIADLGQAAQGIAWQQALQADRRQAAMGNASNIPDGLGAGGLDKDTNPLTQSWINAQDATQTVDANGNVVVNIKQTDAKSILAWQSFNIGQHTTLNFDQSGGTQTNGSNDWVVLNRVNDPNAAPSQILGSIKAQGSVYVLDHNGILFGSGSQINVGSLVASSLNLFSNNLADSNKRFMTGGIGDLNATNVATNSILFTSDANAPIGGDVQIAQGAQLTMGSHGLALIAAPNVTNSGAITAPDGQVALIAGIGVSYDYNASSFVPGNGIIPQGTNDNNTTNLRFANYGALIDASGNDITPVGTLLNDGLIYTPRGNITLLGGAIQQNGEVVATTSVAQPGSIIITSQYEVGVHPGSVNAADESNANFYTGSINFGPQSVTAILADANGATIPSDTASLAPFQTPQGEATFTSVLPTQGLGMIDIIGQSVDMQSGSLLYAPGQTVSASAIVLQDPRADVPAVAGSGRVLLESGATIDVAGLADIELAMSSNLLTVRLSGNELADSPLQQAGFLDNLLVTVDMNDSGVNPETGEAWVGTPLANLTSYEDLVQRSINQLLVNGGAVFLTGNEVDGAPDSTINLMGGYLHYLGGMVKTTRLTDQFGNPVAIGQADPNDTFTGIAGQFIQDHPRWGVKETFSNPLIDHAMYVDDYVSGGNAGSLNIDVTGTTGTVAVTGVAVPGSGAAVLNSTLLAGDVIGSRQITAGTLLSGGSFSFTGISPIEIANGLALAASTLPPDFDMAAPLLAVSGSGYEVNILDSQTLSAADFSSISLTSGGPGETFQPLVEDAGATLTVQPGAMVTQPDGTTKQAGGTISMLVGAATIDGALVAHGGAISIHTSPNSSMGTPAGSVPGDIVIDPGAVLDVSGYFINDRDIPADEQALPLPVDAGSITLLASPGVSNPPPFGGPADPSGTDLSGNITLAAGSLLDLQGGGHMRANGELETDSNGVPLGSGGSLTLTGYLALSQPLFTNDPPLQRGVLTLDGEIDALGFGGGGTLTLQSLALQIGGDPAAASASNAFYFDPAHWGAMGFGSFVLNSLTSATIPDGARITLQHDNLLPTAAIIDAPNGADPAAYATVGLLPTFQRSPTNLTVNAGLFQPNDPGNVPDGTILLGAGAQILGDPGAAISLSSVTNTSVLGTIRAPAGTISLAGGVLYLGPDSLLDVSGVVVIDPLAAPVNTAGGPVTPLTGEVLPGGDINLSGGYTLVAPGATLNVSGTAGTFEVPQSVPGGILGDAIVLAPELEWSNAGAVNIDASFGLVFEGTLIGHGGAPQAEGGTLSLTGTPISVGLSSEMVVVEDMAQTLAQMGSTFDFSTFVLPAPGQLVAPNVPNGVLFGADTLDGSGFANLNLNAGTVGFSGKTTFNLTDSVIFNTTTIEALDITNHSGSSAPLPGTALTVNAPYIAINGTNGSGSGFPQISPDGLTNFSDATLTFNADQIDLSAVSQLLQISQATFNSSGDIRLLPAQVIMPNEPLFGSLATGGDLTLNAARIYPATDTLFVLEAIPADPSGSTTITFGYPQGVAPSSVAPLSAGGAIAVSATNIIQDGDLQAPFGSIFLGLPAGTTVGSVTFQHSADDFIASQSVTLGAGSITSVSGDGETIPFGTTLDQTTWVYNAATNNLGWQGAVDAQTGDPITTSPLTQAPQGVVTVNGASIDYQAGATVNVSGGGDLQAQEWVPGTGGSRDMLSQGLFKDGRQVYAIVPGFSGKAAPYDAMLSQPGMTPGQQVWLDGGPGLPAGYYTLLPAKYATLPGAFRVVVNPAAASTVSNPTFTLPDGTLDMSGHFGNAFDGSSQSGISQFMVQSASTWTRYSQYALTSANTFFPQYASLNSLAAPYIPNDAGRLVLSATTGLMINGQLDGAAGPGGFGGQVDISSQFIQILGQGETVAPGYLGISAASLDALGADSLLIGGTRTITAQGTVITPTANGVIISTDAADPLTGSEILLTAAPQFQSTNIALDNEGDVTTVMTPIAGTGQVTIDSGSVIRATGSGADVGGTAFIMGSALSALPVLPSSADSSDFNSQSVGAGVSFAIDNYYSELDATLGTLVQVSNGTPGTVQMPSASQLSPGPIAVQDNKVSQPGGTFTIELPSLLGAGGGATIDSGARIDGGNVLTIATTGDTEIQPGAMLSAANISMLASSMTFMGSGAGAAPSGGIAIDADLLAQLEQSTNLNLQSDGAIAFDGDVDIQMAGNASTLTLGGSSLSGDGGDVSISAPTLVLDNTLNAAVPATLSGGSGSLTINVGTLVFGAGAKSVAGFGAVNLSASQSMLGQGAGSMDFGDLAVTLQTPALIADTASDQILTTTGALALVSNGAASADADTDALGGAITLQGGSVTVSAPVLAPAGNIALQASTGDIAVTGAGSLIAHGVAKAFGTTEEFAGAGSITLSANQGTVDIQSGATVDFAGAAGGGDGGVLSITTGGATAVTLAGNLLGSTAPGATGSDFNLNSAGALDLDALAQVLGAAGITGGIAIEAGQGDLSLSQSLNASRVSLVADGGSVDVTGTIVANGAATTLGEIDLYGANGVDVEGALTATGSPNSPKQGGLINLGVSGIGSTTSLNSTYGYENIDPSASGTITIGSSAVIDASGGVVTFRAPILDALNAQGANVNINIAAGAQIRGGAVLLDAYAVWSTADQSTNPNQHFDGIIDPAGWYNSSGALEAGAFTDSNGNPVATWDGTTLVNDDGTTHNLSYYLTNDYFAPMATNASHAVFYGGYNPDTETFDPASPDAGSLPAFVQQPGFALSNIFNGVANFTARPEIDLVNPAPAQGGVNGGNISVLTNWNLGAGVQNPDGSLTLAYRYQGTIAPILSLRAGGDVRVDASISDGFFQTGPVMLPTGSPSGPPTYVNALARYNSLVGSFFDESSSTELNLFDGTTQSLTGGDGQPLDPNLVLAAPQPGDAVAYYQNYLDYLSAYSVAAASNNSDEGEIIPITAVQPSIIVPTEPVLPLATDPNYVSDYQTYLSNYSQWLNNFTSFNLYTSGTAPGPSAPASVAQVQNPTLYASYAAADQNYFLYAEDNFVDPNTFSAFSYVFAPTSPAPIVAVAGPVPVPPGANAPSNMGTAANPLPVQFAALMTGQSASYRFVAGAALGSANPLATANPANFAPGATGGLAGEGNVLIDDHIALDHLNGTTAEIVAPTTVRTGTGSIDIAAAENFALLDSLAPGVVYTAGAPVQPAPGDDASIALGEGAFSASFGESPVPGISTVLTSSVNPTNAGDITIRVGGDIIGIENVTDTLADPVIGDQTASGITSSAGAFIGQFWAPWLLANPANPSVAWYVNFGSFDQGVMSVGGNVTVSAGGNIRDLAVSTPTTGYLDSNNALHVTGGGDLSVTAGGNIFSGDFYVGQGAGSIKAGGDIAPDFTYNDTAAAYQVPTLLAVQYATIDVQARGSVDIGGVYDPTFLFSPGTSPVDSNTSTGTTGTALTPYFTTMSPTSGVSIQSTGGDLSFNSLVVQAGLFSQGSRVAEMNPQQFDTNAVVTSLLLPASLSLVALDGGIDIEHGGGLYPSATGSLIIVADQSIELGLRVLSGTDEFGRIATQLVNFGDPNISGTTLGKLDDQVGTGILPTANDQQLVVGSDLTQAQTRDPALVGPGATGTVLIYALNGSLIDGTPSLDGKQGAEGATIGQISLIPNAPAQIFAGQDILDLPFFGENFNANDITSLIAGEDIRYNILGNGQPAAIELAGPGTLLVQAGRDFNLQTQRVTDAPESGIRTLGNSVDPLGNPYGLNLLSATGPNPDLTPYNYGNPYLPEGGASVMVLFGVGKGTNQAGFVSQYIDPANAAVVLPSSTTALISFVDQYEINAGNSTAAPTTADQAWAIFQTLPANRQQLLVDQLFLSILDATGKDFNDPASPFFQQYARGYQAINTLFPASLGYTANDLTGGADGATQTAVTGDFDMRGSTVQTQQGGDISIFGPGGRILVGSADASPTTNPASEGILTLEQGSIDIFADTDVLVAQSRIMTEQGGNVVMWSSNGNLDAGKGAKTSVSLPPPLYACDIDFVCEADIKGFVSGAGIATLQSLPDVPVGDANLIAPRGTVDAGAAGIRVSGNINIAALEVDNAANIDVQGKATGLPGVVQVNVGDLTNASAVASQAALAAQDVVHQQQAAARQALPSIFTVRVLGFGNDASDSGAAPASSSSGQQSDASGYDRKNRVQVVGHGESMKPELLSRLTAEERRALQQDH
jgi:filamentous hemagglutinin family protein